jgi:hypothetical protein
LRADEPERELLALKNTNTARVYKELDELIAEWRAWQEEVKAIIYPPLDRHDPRPLQSIYRDTPESLKRHRILEEKTLVFLDNNIAGHGFGHGRDGTRSDSTDLWLKFRVEHRVDDLDELRACLRYAKVPDGYWTAKAKEMLDQTAKKPLDVAIDVASKFLQGIM